MIKIDDWCIDADSRCYIIGKQKTRVTKDGEVEEYLAGEKYYSNLPAALNGIKEAERRSLVHSQDMTIQEAIKLIREHDEKLYQTFNAMEE